VTAVIVTGPLAEKTSKTLKNFFFFFFPPPNSSFNLCRMLVVDVASPHHPDVRDVLARVNPDPGIRNLESMESMMVMMMS